MQITNPAGSLSKKSEKPSPNREFFLFLIWAKNKLALAGLGTYILSNGKPQAPRDDICHPPIAPGEPERRRSAASLFSSDHCRYTYTWDWEHVWSSYNAEYNEQEGLGARLYACHPVGPLVN